MEVDRAVSICVDLHHQLQHLHSKGFGLVTLTSSSVGFWPMDLITPRSSLVEMEPLPSWRPGVASD